MALKSAYNYVRENIDSNFDKYVADNVSYGCEEDIEDIKRWISEEGEDAQVALYCKNRSRMIKYFCPEKDSHNFPVLLLYIFRTYGFLP